MAGAVPLAAPWLVRAFHELHRRRHLVVHGNVDDLVRWNHRYLPLPEALAEFLAMAGFGVVGRHSLVDGLTYRDAAAQQTGERLLRRGTGADGAAGDGGSTAGDHPRGATPGGWRPFTGSAEAGTHGPRAAEGSGAAEAGGPAADRSERLGRARAGVLDAVNNARPPRPRTAADALGTIRRLMTQAQAPSAIVLDAADLIVGVDASPDETRPLNIAHVRRLLVEAVDAGSGPTGRTLRNTLVFVSRDLGCLPEWLRENPNVATVLAERPGSPERADLIERQFGGLHGASACGPDARRQAVSALVNLTDGMTVRDIQTIEVTSQLTSIGPGSPRKLVARHRFGAREDPWESLDMDTVRHAETVLNERVMGQPYAVRAVSDALVNARVGIDFVAGDADTGGRPKGVFFFAGPTGVGKTELAKAIAELVFADESALRRFDMSEFSQEHASERLTGAPPGYIGHEQGGVLTNWVLERPFSVILFDEIEKAHPKIFDKFLQIIDDGRLTDGQGRTAYFSHSIVIFTSNLGAASLAHAHPGAPPTYEFIQRHFADEVSAFFTERLGRPELLGRLGSGVVAFDILRQGVIRRITGKFLDQISASARARGYEMVFDRPAIDRAVVEHIMTTGAALGARPIRDPLLERWIRIPLNRWVMANSPPPGSRIWVHRTQSSPPFSVALYPDTESGGDPL